MLPLLTLLFPGTASAMEDFYGAAYYFGDLHAHTGGSGDGGSNDLRDCGARTCGRFQDLVSIARDDNGLDFVAVVDHVNGITSGADERDWGKVFPFVNEANDEAGGFVTIPGAEVHFATVDGELGHTSLLLFGDVATLSAVSITDLQPNGAEIGYVADCAAVGSYFDGVEALFGDALLLPHHPAADRPMPTDWGCHDDRYAPAAEVYSEHGNSLTDDDSWDQPSAGFVEASSVTAALDPAGYDLRLGFFAGSDNHDTHPGMVCGYDSIRTGHPYSGAITILMLDPAETFDRDAVHDALVERRSYASTGPQLPLFVDYSQRNRFLGGIGDEVVASPATSLSARLRLPSEYADAILSVDFVGPDGSFAATEFTPGVWRVNLPAGTVPAYLYADVQVDGDWWWLGVGGCEDGGGDTIEHVWTSPTWFD